MKDNSCTSKMHRVASERRKEIEGKTQKKVEGWYPTIVGSYMVKKSKGQTEVEGSRGGQCLGTRYKHYIEISIPSRDFGYLLKYPIPLRYCKRRWISCHVNIQRPQYHSPLWHIYNDIPTKISNWKFPKYCTLYRPFFV